MNKNQWKVSLSWECCRRMRLPCEEAEPSRIGAQFLHGGSEGCVPKIKSAFNRARGIGVAGSSTANGAG